MKQRGMLVASLYRGINFRFWSRLGCSGQSANILSAKVSFRVPQRNTITQRETEVKFSFFLAVSFRGQNLLNTNPDWSPLGVKFKLSDEHPRLFHMGAPPRVGTRKLVMLYLFFQEGTVMNSTI